MAAVHDKTLTCETADWAVNIRGLGDSLCEKGD